MFDARIELKELDIVCVMQNENIVLQQGEKEPIVFPKSQVQLVIDGILSIDWVIARRRESLARQRQQKGSDVTKKLGQQEVAHVPKHMVQGETSIIPCTSISYLVVDNDRSRSIGRENSTAYCDDVQESWSQMAEGFQEGMGYHRRDHG